MVMWKRIPLMLVTVAALVTAGCTNGDYYSYSTGGSNPGDVSDTFSVSSGEARASFSVGGAGSATVTIKDADGKQLLRESFSGSGGNAKSQTLSGAAGTWSIAIDFDNWNGGFAINIGPA